MLYYNFIVGEKEEKKKEKKKTSYKSKSILGKINHSWVNYKIGPYH